MTEILHDCRSSLHAAACSHVLASFDTSMFLKSDSVGNEGREFFTQTVAQLLINRLYGSAKCRISFSTIESSVPQVYCVPEKGKCIVY